MNQTAALQLRLLGKPQVQVEGAIVSGFRTAKAEALLYYLAVTGQSYSREVLADLLWGEMSETTAKRNLTKALSHLRKQLAPFLVIEPDTVGLDPVVEVWLDVAVFETAVTAGLAEDDLAQLTEAVALYQGDLLAGFYVKQALSFEEWLLGERERLRELMLQALQRLVSEAIKQGEPTTGLEYAQQLLALEPWHETAHRHLMLLLARTGRREAALVQYKTCRQVLAEVLGVEPMAETTALFERLKAAGAPPPHNLPSPPNAFVGRETELQRLERQLADPACRLATIVGPGGIGKTRLALEAARRYLQSDTILLEPDVSDGIYSVSLASIGGEQPPTEAEQSLSGLSNALISAIAEGVGLSFHGSADLQGQLLNYLQPKAMLLLLDNFEYLLVQASGKPNADSEPGIALITTILQEAPRLKILVTSRERLNLQQEWVVEVAGLEYPSGGDWERGSRGGDQFSVSGDRLSIIGHQPIANNLQAYSAVTLFSQRAAQALTGQGLTETDWPDVGHICRLVEGMPLALELAASWLRTLSCAEIATKIKNSLDFLETSLPNVPARHRSLRAVFEHSWTMLSQQEQSVFAKLSIFRGGFSREAATKVGNVSVLMMARLVDKSLLRHRTDGRYELHELLRQYAGEKLLALTTPSKAETTQPTLEPLQAVWRRYSLYYLDLLRQRERVLLGNQPQKPLAELRADLDNIRQAWLWAVNEGEAQALEQATGGLSRFFDLTGLFTEGADTFRQAADHLDTLLPSRKDDRAQIQAARGRILVEQAGMLHRRGLPDQAATVAQQATELAQTLQSTYLEALARHRWGDTLSYGSAYEPAQIQLEQALSLARQAQLPQTEAEILRDMAIVAVRVGQYDEAKQLCRQAETAFIAQGDQRGIGVIRLNLGNIAYFQADLAQAKQTWSEAAQNFVDSDDLWGEYLTKCNLGHLAYDEGRYDEALELIQASLATAEQVQDLVHTSISCEILGNIFRQQGDYDTAQSHYKRGLDLAHQAGYRLTEGHILAEKALVFHDLGQLEAALQSCQEAQILAEDIGVPSLTIQVLTNLGRIHLARQSPTEAADVFQQALASQGAREDWRRAVEAKAGLAAIYLQQDDLPQALEQIEPILQTLEQPAALAIPELFRVFLACYQILHQAGDTRAGPVLERANHLLQERAAAIGDERRRRSFLENVPSHRELGQALCRA